MTSTNKFSQFLKDEKARRGMSIRQLAEFMGVSPTTISRAIDEGDPKIPGLDFLMKVSEATGVSITALIEMAYPDLAKGTSLSAEAQILAQQIEGLPQHTRDVILSIIRGTKPE